MRLLYSFCKTVSRHHCAPIALTMTTFVKYTLKNITNANKTYVCWLTTMYDKVVLKVQELLELLEIDDIEYAHNMIHDHYKMTWKELRNEIVLTTTQTENDGLPNWPDSALFAFDVGIYDLLTLCNKPTAEYFKLLLYTMVIPEYRRQHDKELRRQNKKLDAVVWPRLVVSEENFAAETHVVGLARSRSPILQFVRTTHNASKPEMGSANAAGFDLKSAHDYVVPARGKELIETDLQLALPAGCYGRVAPRSGLALNNFIDVGAGVIDEDYRGNVGVVLFNHANVDFIVKKGDRVAQLICEKIYYPKLVEVASLPRTVRGADGFGSTGK
ncbi:Bro-c [Artaxa digramma nucleopolyhedrovirus]|uniref:dUTP diphosphatase n=1 Tax=Artaxa digramma nucleopolyhedrovirus TaxID=3070910 RepID=A0AAE6R6X5_9ABAC|nr:Bro-c [Euproctis digramma nucleopolyhedrovirus]QHB21719.1 Bro-c [Artaxa digramma nucleopolyhedrovirus]